MNNNAVSNYEDNRIINYNNNFKNNSNNNLQIKDGKTILEQPTQIFSLLKKPNF